MSSPRYGKAEPFRRSAGRAAIFSHLLPPWAKLSRYLVGVSNHQKGASLWIVSVADGKHREVANVAIGSFQHAAFSPDGRFVAYQTAPPMLEAGKHHIFVVPTQGGEPHLVYKGDFEEPIGYAPLLDWTADGRYLAVADTPSGKMGLYLLPVKNGEAAGQPVLVRYGDFGRGYTTLAGTLVYRSTKLGGQNKVYLTSLDADSHPGGWQRMDLRGGSFFSVPFPSFSPDAKQIAYVTKDAERVGGELLVLRDLSSGEERVLYRGNGTLFCQFAWQHPKLFCTEQSSSFLPTRRRRLSLLCRGRPGSVLTESGSSTTMRMGEEGKACSAWRLPEARQSAWAISPAVANTVS